MKNSMNLNEFQEDLGKQCIVLMGLPGSGKSTFIQNEVKTYIPGFKNYKTVNSDNQVRQLQYKTAESHYNSLIANNDIQNFIEKTKYIGNRGNEIVHPITLDWWETNKDKGVSYFWKTFYKPFYAIYFDIRTLAKEIDKELFNTKIIKSGNLLIVDTVGIPIQPILERLQKTKNNNFTNVIIYLEIDPELCLTRDRYREEREGRGVGENVIYGYADKIEMAFDTYKLEGQKEDGIVDRIIHFNWIPSGDSPIKGTWKLIKDYRYSLIRKKQKR